MIKKRLLLVVTSCFLVAGTVFSSIPNTVFGSIPTTVEAHTHTLTLKSKFSETKKNITYTYGNYCCKCGFTLVKLIHKGASGHF